MIRIFLIVVISIMTISPVLRAQEVEERRPVAIFASEKIHGNWIRSYYNSILESDVAGNECELILRERFENRGFSVANAPVADERIKDARKMMIVFQRYNDMSSIPNDIIVKAASIAGLDSGAVIGCGVYVNEKKKKRQVCAASGCKVVDMKTKRRMLAATKEKCLDNSGQVNMGVAAVRDVCSETGEYLSALLRK